MPSTEKQSVGERSADERSTEERSTDKPSGNCLQRISHAFIGRLEKVFFRIGLQVGKRPAATIVLATFVSLLSVIGFMGFYEVDPLSPEFTDGDSQYARDKKWVDDNFPSRVRNSIYMIEAPNILDPAVIQELSRISYHVTDEMDDSYYFHCTKLGEDVDSKCYTTNILELWKFNRTVISSLTAEDIRLAVNTTTRSPWTGAPIDLGVILGQVERNNDGMIISAKVTLMSYFLKGNESSIVAEDDYITRWARAWENKFINFGIAYQPEHTTKISIYTDRSVTDALNATVFDSLFKFGGGVVLLLIFATIVFGRFSWVGLKIWLAISLLGGVTLALAIALGLGSGFGLGFSAVTSLIPFLLMGLGVDDGFVIVQSWRRLGPDKQHLPIEQKAAYTLMDAGMSITVTTMTDFIAFGVGATTILPALRNFCIYAVIGIISVFFIQSTFFLACLVLDEKRVSQKRNGCIPCFTHNEEYEPNKCSHRNIMQDFFDKLYGPFLLKLPVKIVVLLLSLGLLGTSIYAVTQLKTEYDTRFYIPYDFYLNDYIDRMEIFFPDIGFYANGYIYMSDIDYFAEIHKLNLMMSDFRSNQYVNADKVDFWLEDFKAWLQTISCPWVNSYLNSTSKWPINKEGFEKLVKSYVYITLHGSRHLHDIKFDGSIDLDTSTVTSVHNDPAIIGSSDPLSNSDVIALDNKLAGPIPNELFRNLGLAFASVYVLVLILIADIFTAFFVSFCTLSAIVETGGLMFFWGVTVEMVSSVLLLISVGFAVDYSAHIGHTFMTVIGTRNERALKTIGNIGPAVFSGGFSTFLVMSIMTYFTNGLFATFYKVNLCIIFNGLWNGLVFLPVLLSWMGPAPYLSAFEDHKLDEEIKKGEDNKGFHITADNTDTLEVDENVEKIDLSVNQTKTEQSPAKVSILSQGKHSTTASSINGSPRKSTAFVSNQSLSKSHRNSVGLPDID